MNERKGLITLPDALALGLSRHTVKKMVQSGEWVEIYRRVYRSGSVAASLEQETLGAVLAAGAGAVASHRSSAWLWGLCPAPAKPIVTVPRCRQAKVPGVVIHRALHFEHSDVHLYKAIPCTSPLRAILDMAATAGEDELDAAIDRLLSTQMGSAGALEGEIARQAGRGRRGIGPLRAALKRRGLTGAPAPSVLESRTDRLLATAGVKPLGREVKTGDGWYRVDYLLAPGVIMEVSGHAYHWSPEQRRHDEERRNRLVLAGNVLLTYTWRDVVCDPLRLVDELREALRASCGAGPSTSTSTSMSASASASADRA